MAGHHRWFRQAQDVEQGRRDVRKPAVFEMPNCAWWINHNQGHRVEGMGRVWLARFRVAHHLGIAMISGDDKRAAGRLDCLG